MQIPTFQEALAGYEAMISRTTMGALGIVLVDFGPDHLVLEMPITDAARQPMGLLHGGVNMVLAESAASMHAALTCDTSKEAPVGIEINGSHIRSAKEGRVRATAKVIRRSRTLVVHEIEMTLVETGELLCISRVTNLFRPHR
jgi:uncharacterized protein (TIGR00369 family)